MRKYILPILLFLVSVSPAFGAYTERTNCADLNPTISDAHKITCKQTTAAGGRAAGHLYNWNGVAWVDIDTDIIGGSDDDQTASEVPVTPFSSIASTNVQAALEEIVAEVALAGDAENINFTPSGNIAATDVQAAIQELDTEKSSTAHTHAAAAITNTPAGLVSSTTVQAAINELDNEKSPTSHNHDAAYKAIGDDAADLAYTPADGTDWGVDPNDVAEALDQVALRVTDIEADNATQTELDAHINDATAAHAGTAISNAAAGNISSTTVQAAINELDTEKQPLDTDLTTIAALVCDPDEIIKRGAAAWECGVDDNTGSGGISGLTTGTYPRAASATTIEDGSISEPTPGELCFGDCSTNYIVEDYSGISGAVTRTRHSASGTEAITTGALTSGNLTRIDASGRIIDGGTRVITRNVTILEPTTAESQMVQIQFQSAVTLTEIGCSTDTGTATINGEKRGEATPNTTGTTALTSDLVCDNDRQESSTFTSAGVAANEVLSIEIVSVASTPGVVRIHIYARPD